MGELACVRQHALNLLKDEKNILVRLDHQGDSLWSVFLNSLPLNRRREWSCWSCERFLNSYGALGVMLPNHITVPLFWSQEGKGFEPDLQNASKKLFDALAGRPVAERYVPPAETIGTQHAGGFEHFCFTFPKQWVKSFGHDAATALDKELLDRVLASNKLPEVKVAYDLLTQDELPHADKHKRSISALFHLIEALRDHDPKAKETPLTDLNPAAPGGPTENAGSTERAIDPKERAVDSKERSLDSKEAANCKEGFKLSTVVGVGAGSARDNLVWKAALSAGASTIHSLRSGVVGKLLEDLTSGLDIGKVKANWAHMVDPANYMRPKAPPSQQLVQQAEKLFSELKITSKALERSYLTDLPLQHTLWSGRRNHDAKENSGAKGDGAKGDAKDGAAGKEAQTLFGLIKCKTTAALAPVKLPWLTFLRSVLINAEEVWYKTPSGTGCFYQLIRSAEAKSFPLMQWHSEENSVSWFTLLTESERKASAFGMKEDDWVRVTDVCKFPHLWQHPEKFSHFGEHRYLCVLEGARYTRVDTLCLFPEFMRNEFHPYRAVLEQYSKEHAVNPTRPGEQPIAGVALEKSTNNDLQNAPHLFQVKNKSSATTTLFQIDSLQ